MKQISLKTFIHRLDGFLYYPILIAVYPILFFYAYNQTQLKLSIITPVLILSLLLTISSWLVLKLITKSWTKSGLMTGISVLLFFIYGHLTRLINQYIFITIPTTDIVIGPDKIVLPLFVVLLISSFIWISKAKQINPQLHRYLNYVTIIMVSIQLMTITTTEQEITTKQELSTEDKSVVTSTTDTPDIYYIILDAYARADILEQYYDYSNQDFLNSLSNMGFQIADKATSNYAHTVMSLSSSLNYTYHDQLAEDKDPQSQDFRGLDEMIRNSMAVSFAKSQGYEVINFSSGWGPTDQMTAADENISKTSSFTFMGEPLSLNEFYLVFLQTTALSPFIQDTLAEQARGKILYALDALTEVPYRRGKHLVIAHFNSPHPPYLFDSEGNPIPDQDLELAGDEFEDRYHYLEQLIFMSNRIDDTIQKIIERSDEPPIIILHSDHGPASILGHPHQWQRPPDEEGVKERFSILYAVHTPGLNELPENMSPINTFPYIFNHYFQSDIELQENKLTYTDFSGGWDFLDVTDILE